MKIIGKYKSAKTRFFLALVFCFCATFCLAQRPPDFGGATSPTLDSLEENTGEEDTANIAYFLPDNLGRFLPENDSLLGNFFHQFNPARRRQLDYFTLGNLTSAAYPSVWTPQNRVGLDVGLHAYDLYHIKNEDVRFYQQTKPFLDAYYTSRTLSDGMMQFRFGRNFANNLNLSIESRRVYNFEEANRPVFFRTAADGRREWQYDGLPRGRTVAFAVGLWGHRKNYDGFLTFTSNFTIQNDFGGIADPSVFERPSVGSVLGARISQANTRQEKYEVNYLHYFKLNGRRDSLATSANRRVFQATHKILFRSQLYFFNDVFGSRDTTFSATDSAFYRTLARDPRGMRFFLTERTLENQFSLSTSRQRRLASESIAQSPTASAGQNDWFEVGLTHQFSRLNQELGGRNFNNLILRGRWFFSPNDNVRVETQARFNALGTQIGDYQLAGEMFFNWQNVGSIALKAINQLYAPTYLQNDMVLMRTRIWENSLSKTLETHLSATLRAPKLGFEATGAYTLLNNYIFFDSTFTPQQRGTPLSILQLILNQNFKLGVFNLENTGTLQTISDTILRLPNIYTKHSLFAEGRIFKRNMLARVGFDARFNTAWSAPDFQPATGQFFVPNSGEVPLFLALDAFLSLKVRSFRFFVKMENVLGEWGLRDIYFQTYRYPVPERVFRFGVGWRLLN